MTTHSHSTHAATATTPPTFASLGLSPDALRALADAGFTAPTPIQLRAIPPALEGRDVIGCAATGTGKTAAFLLPILEKLAGTQGTRALVLAPTRELALQIAEQAERFGSARGVRSATLIGGVGMQPQTDALRRGAQLLIATPGRLIDHLQQGTAKLDRIAFLVLDEADRMLDMGFKPQLTKILAKVPRARQTLLFSATMAGEVGEFAKANSSTPVKIEVNPSGTTAARATQLVYLCSQDEKTPLLLSLLSRDEASTLVFTRTKRRADKIAKALEREGHSVARIHADRSQGQRRSALEGFRDFKFRILVATDIAARGIDVAEIGHVVNYDLPHVPEDYVHRIGRTARASAAGHASSFAAPDEVGLLRDIERYVRAPIPRGEVPRSEPAFSEAVAGAKARQAHPGPPQKHHAPQRSQASHGGRSGGGGGGGGGRQQKRRGGSRPHAHASPASSSTSGGSPKSVFRGSPKRRR